MFVNSLFERLDTVTLYFSYHSVWESVPYPNRRMKEGSVQCWCFSMRHGHSMIRHGWAGTSCSAGCVWIWQQCLEISRTVTGVHFIKHCDSSYFPSVLEASDGQFPTGSNLIYSNDSESFLLNWIKLVSLFFPAPGLCAMNPCFFQGLLVVTVVTKTDTNV